MKQININKIKKINMADPSFTFKDEVKIKNNVSRILRNSLSMGPNVFNFQNDFSKKLK